MTVEPGVYVKGRGGLRLEDDYLMSQVTVKEAREDSASASSPENNVLSEEDNG